jgi:hypothetical protein
MASYKEIKPVLLQLLQKLCDKHKLSLVNKIKKETDKANMLSLINEGRFGLFFDSYGASLRYDRKVFSGSNKTPDWAVNINGQTIIAEVYRLNPAKQDQDEIDLENQAIEEFELKNPGVPFVGSYHPITIKPEKLEGAKGCLIDKKSKYAPLIEVAELPFIICLHFDFVCGIDALDLSKALYGPTAEFHNSFAYNGYYPGSVFRILEDALYYADEEMKQSVSGVLLRTETDFLYFHNYNPKNRLNKINRAWLLNFQHQEQ